MRSFFSGAQVDFLEVAGEIEKVRVATILVGSVSARLLVLDPGRVRWLTRGLRKQYARQPESQKDYGRSNRR